MISKVVPQAVKKYLHAPDWKLLIFLLLFCQVKLLLKIVAVIIMYILRADFRFGFRMRNSRLPLFYPMIILVAFINLLLTGLFTNWRYDTAFALGIGYWCLCLLAMHQVKLSVESMNSKTLENTLLVFFLLNAIVSLSVYAGIVIETGTINPYRYQGDHQKYFIGTGDYIKGISFDTSTTNAVLNAMGVIFFLYKNRTTFVLLCMLVLLLTGSNMINILLVFTLLLVFIFRSGRYQKSSIVICFALLAVFWMKVSPQNNSYISGAWRNFFHQPEPGKHGTAPLLPLTLRPDSTLTPVEKREKIARLYVDSITTAMAKVKVTAVQKVLPDTVLSVTGKPRLPEDNIHTAAFQHKWDTTVLQKQLAAYVKEEKLRDSTDEATLKQLPGKLEAWRQTVRYMKEHPSRIFFGAGMGNFSSKLAFRITGLGIAGSYPKRMVYVTDDFKKNHLELQLAYYIRNDSLHSLTNSPNAVYNQLLSEYGIAGLLAIGFCYFLYFFKRCRQHYGLPLLVFMMAILFTDYWFEQLSVIVLFELMMFMNQEKNKHEIE